MNRPAAQVTGKSDEPKTARETRPKPARSATVSPPVGLQRHRFASAKRPSSSARRTRAGPWPGPLPGISPSGEGGSAGAQAGCSKRSAGAFRRSACRRPFLSAGKVAWRVASGQSRSDQGEQPRPQGHPVFAPAKMSRLGHPPVKALSPTFMHDPQGRLLQWLTGVARRPAVGAGRG